MTIEKLNLPAKQNAVQEKINEIIEDTQLEDLDNVSISNPSQGQNLTYDETNRVWKNMSVSATMDWGGLTGDMSNQSDLMNALNDKIETSEKGAANGVASLDANKKIPSTQIPDLSSTYSTVANTVSDVSAGTTANKINVTKNGSTSTITVDNVTSATTASKLGSTTIGSTTTPIYLSNGTPTALNYTIEKSVPSNAVFTDTTYSAGNGINITGTTISTDTTIASKTDIGSANLTIKRNGASVGTFSANATSSVEVNISVPTTATEVGALPSDTIIGDGKTIFKKNGTAFATISANQTSTINVDYTIPTAVTDLSDASNYALKSDVASAIIPKGSKAAVTDLPTPASTNLGWMYNMTAAFTTTADFVEGASKKYPAGTNVVIVEYSTGTYKYDIFAGFVDTTSYDTHLANTTIHVTSTDKSTWNAKQDALTPGSNISISGGTISATDTTYSAGAGLTLSGTQFKHSNSVTAGTAGTSTATSGSTLAVPYVTYDAQGHVTASGTHTHTITGFLTSHQTIKNDGITGATINRYGACSTAAGTAQKEVTPTTGTVSLEAGLRVAVKFANANTADSPTLKVGSNAAKNIFHKGAQITTGGNKALLAGICDFIYDGTQFHLVGNYIDTDTVYVHPTTSGNKHIPSGGSSGQILKYSADGTAQWANEYSYTHPTTSGNKHIPSGGSSGQILKWSADGTATWAAEYSYTHPTTSGNKHIPSGGSSGQILRWSSDGTAAWGDDNNTDTNVTNTLNTTAKAYLTGTTTATTNTGTQVFDTGVYLTTTAGKFNANSVSLGSENVTMQYNSTTKSVDFVFP